MYCAQCLAALLSSIFDCSMELTIAIFCSVLGTGNVKNEFYVVLPLKALSPSGMEARGHRSRSIQENRIGVRVEW